MRRFLMNGSIEVLVVKSRWRKDAVAFRVRRHVKQISISDVL
jgi:hypothetical protein